MNLDEFRYNRDKTKTETINFRRTFFIFITQDKILTKSTKKYKVICLFHHCTADVVLPFSFVSVLLMRLALSHVPSAARSTPQLLAQQAASAC